MAARRGIKPSEDARYLAMRREGRTYRDIALLCGVSVGTVATGVKRAKDRQKQAAEPVETPAPRQPAWVHDMVPMFPIKALDDQSVCPHNGPIPRGSMFVCMICHQSGMDHRSALHRNPATDPKPEPKPKPKDGPKPNRKERRRRERTAA
jgi:hypothetical protein